MLCEIRNAVYPINAYKHSIEMQLKELEYELNGNGQICNELPSCTVNIDVNSLSLFFSSYKIHFDFILDERERVLARIHFNITNHCALQAHKDIFLNK